MFLVLQGSLCGRYLTALRVFHGCDMLESYLFCKRLHCTMVFSIVSVWSKQMHNEPATHIFAYSSWNCGNCSIVLSNPIELEQYKQAVHKCIHGTFSEHMPNMTCGLCGLPRGIKEMVLWHLAIDHNETHSYYGRFLQIICSHSTIGFTQESIAQDVTFQL